MLLGGWHPFSIYNHQKQLLQILAKELMKIPVLPDTYRNMSSNSSAIDKSIIRITPWIARCLGGHGAAVTPIPLVSQPCGH